MELKKKPKADINKSRGVFLNIGLLLSLFIVIVAFEWKTYDDVLLGLGMISDDFEEQIEIPITEQPPPPHPKIQPPEIIEIPDEEVIKEEIKRLFDSEFVEDTAIEVEDEPEEEFTDKPFIIVEKMPEPVGGFKEFYKYLANHINYPEPARRAGVQGIVYVQFVVEKDGSLSHIEVLKGIGMGCDEEAVRVLKKAPKWNPGKQRGKPVRVKHVARINFMH